MQRKPMAKGMRFDGERCDGLSMGSGWAESLWIGGSFMNAECFVDTNILVYAHDQDAGGKHKTAKRLVAGLWKQRVWPVVSVQVLQELYVNLHRKGVSIAEAKEVVGDYSAWQVVENTVSVLEAGIDEMRRWQFSFWDSLILAAARQAGVSVIYSEDMSDSQDYAGLRVENPFV